MFFKDLLGAISSVLAVFIYIGIATGIYDHFAGTKSKQLSQTFGSQLKTLNATEANLKELLKFVENQKNGLAETEKTIQSLKAEHERLLPLVKADRHVVEALLLAQEERNNSKVWAERGISFVLGIIASLLASGVYSIVTKLAKNKHIRGF